MKLKTERLVRIRDYMSGNENEDNIYMYLIAIVANEEISPLGGKEGLEIVHSLGSHLLDS